MVGLYFFFQAGEICPTGNHGLAIDHTGAAQVTKVGGQGLAVPLRTAPWWPAGADWVIGLE